MQSPALAAISAFLFLSICAAQFAEPNASGVVVREVHFKGQPGGTDRQLGESTEFLLGHRMEQKATLQEATSAVTAFLRHKGYWKSEVTPQLRPTKTFGNAKEQPVALDITMAPSIRYRVKATTFTGISQEAQESDLRQSCTLNEGDVADGEQVGVCITNLRSLFQKRGLDVAVIPSMTFDDEHATVTIDFDIEK